ncbi:MAG: glycosyltransferase family 39 protein [Chloroflexi bacterium]|nr:glycosyltransferase family 39 protein [Chloroflexota bacterium]
MLDVTAANPVSRVRAIAFPRRIAAHHAALAGVIALSLFFEFFRLDREGFANLYYAAAAKSMGTSWHDFYFVSYDSGGFVSVDKPPAGLWLQVASAKLFGFHGWSLLAPQAAAAVASVAVLYHLVARVFGRWPGVAAALVLAVMPVTVSASRNNTSDVVLVFTLLLAAWAVTIATERASLRWLLAGAALVGVGFNVKMMQAYLVVPALAAVYFLGMTGSWKARFGHLVAAFAVMLAVSMSWAITVELTPAGQRPYVGSTDDNSVFGLMWNHNGLERLLPGWGPFGRNNARPAAQPADQQPADQPAQGQQLQGQQPQQGQQPGGPAQPAQGAPGGAGGGETGTRGAFRLFNRQLAGQASWLLPLAFVGLVVAAAQHRPRWPLDRKHQALVLWGVWLLTNVAFFSVANLFHRYYLVMLGPPIAALAAAGIAALWRQYRHGDWRTLLLPLAIAGSAAVEFVILGDYPDWRRRLLAALVVAGASSALLLLAPVAGRLSRRRVPGPVLAGIMSVGFLSLLAAPTAWAAVTVWDGQTSSGLPAAGPAAGGRFGPPAGNGAGATADPLVTFLTANRGTTEFILATASTQQGSSIILATGEPVMALGGFSGGDPILTPQELEQAVVAGRVRYFLLQGTGTPVGPAPVGASQGAPASGDAPVQRQPVAGPGGGQQGANAAWVSAHCSAVPVALWRGAQPAAVNQPVPGGVNPPQQGVPIAGQVARPQQGQPGAPGAAPNQGPNAGATLFDCGEGARH